MEHNYDTIDLYDLVRKIFQFLLRTWKAALPVLLLTACGTAAFIRLSYTPLYESRATFAVTKEMNGEENYLYNKDAADELSVSFESILYSDVMQDAMKADLGTETLPASIVASRVGTTNLFTVAAQSEDPEAAEKVVQVFLDNYARVFRAALMEISLEMIESPEAASVCNTPDYLRAETWACGGVLMAYAVLAGAYAFFRRTITEEEEVRESLRTGCLGTLPYVKAAERKKGTAVPLITRDSSRNFEMKEAVAAVRRRLEKEKERSGTCTYLLAGASEGEGVSTAAANLALSLAYRGWKTALVDLNLRKPAQLKRIPIKKDTELQNVMQVEGTAFLAERTALSGRLTVYGIQEPADRAAKILGSPMIRRFLEGMKERYDFLVIDSPPLLSYADGQTLAKLVDAAIFVLREDHLSVGKLVDAMEMLNESAPAVLGGVMNGSRIHVSRYGYGYGYGYSYGYKYRYGYGYRKRYGYGSRGEKSKDRDSDKVKKRKGEKSDETEKNL